MMQLHLVNLSTLDTAHTCKWPQWDEKVELEEGRLQLSLHLSAISKAILMFQPWDKLMEYTGPHWHLEDFSQQ